MTNFRILKGKNADKFYPAPKVTPANIGDIIKWMGESNLVNELQTLLKRKFQNIASDATSDETGFDETLFVKYATEFTSAGLKLKEINDKLDELQAQLTKLIDAGEWQTNPEVAKELAELNNQVRAYRQMREDRQRKPKEEAEDAPSVAAN